MRYKPIQCDFCKKEFERYEKSIKKDRNFCSRECMNSARSKKHNPEGYRRNFNAHHLAELNRKLNPTRMTQETKARLRAAHLGKGEGKAYTKIHGRHTHRIMAEVILGRPLKKGEVVHHIDGNKLNNSPENLIVFPSQKEHARHHKMLTAKEVVPT
jgi:hypothetical protein